MGCAKSEVDPDCSFWILMPTVEKRRRPAQTAVLKKENGHFVKFCGGLENDGAQTAERANEFGGQGVHGFNTLHLRMQRGSGFEGQLRRGLVALGAER